MLPEMSWDPAFPADARVGDGMHSRYVRRASSYIRYHVLTYNQLSLADAAVGPRTHCCSPSGASVRGVPPDIRSHVLTETQTVLADTGVGPGTHGRSPSGAPARRADAHGAWRGACCGAAGAGHAQQRRQRCSAAVSVAGMLRSCQQWRWAIRLPSAAAAGAGGTE